MTATETTKKPFDNISRKLTFKETLLKSFSGSLSKTAIVIVTVASILLFLAIGCEWLKYKVSYPYFTILYTMQTTGLLIVSSGILFAVIFKVLLTITRGFVGSYGRSNFNLILILILTLILTVSIVVLFISSIINAAYGDGGSLVNRSDKSSGNQPKQDEKKETDK
ncbi:hypothetical protein GINT2_000876 [Glugoides intestinalis]